ncbi:MAG: outer membrane beta-barrel protein [Desulfovibrio sp.]|jgi:opacity protein-like surface antigen|nr:outer membrane beta-barrel protein [Desulfovibrio sp.]
MFKHFILAAALVLGLALPAASAEVNGFYAGVKFIDSIQGTGSVEKSSELDGFGIGQFSQNTVGGGAFVGWDFYPQSRVPLRTEIEYAIRSNMSKTWEGVGISSGEEIKQERNLQTLLFNLYYDFHNDSAFTPYLGAGAGVGFIRSKFTASAGLANDSETYSQTVFAYNVGAGVSYAFTDNVSADLAYRFLGLTYNEINDGDVRISSTPYANEVSLGLRFTF